MLGGCGAGPVDAQVFGGKTALISGGDGEATTQLTGVVSTTKRGCLGLLMEGATEPVPMIWPESSELNNDGTSLNVPQAGVVRVGQSIEGDGSEVSELDDDRYAEVPEVCRGEGRLIDAAAITKARNPQ